MLLLLMLPMKLALRGSLDFLLGSHRSSLRSLNFLWRWLYLFQLILYSGAFLLLSLQAYEAWPNLLTARFGGWHLLITIQYIIVAIYIRLKQPKTFWGTIHSFTVALLAGVVGECYYTYVYSLQYFQPWSQQAVMDFWYWGTIEFTIMAFLCWASGAFKQINWYRILGSFLALAPLMLYWIIALEFRVSVCMCNYRLQYYTDPFISLIEILYWTIFFGFYVWAVK